MEQTTLGIPESDTRTYGPWPPGYDVARCRSCNEPIRWATAIDAITGRPRRNPKTGKIVKVPLDLELAASDATHVLVTDGRVRTIGRGELGIDPLTRVRNHFRSCPHAKQHTRR